MLKLSGTARSSRYTPIVGCAFLVEMLYGSKYSANLGTYNMPYVYVKTILLCATGHGLELREGRYIHGLIELLLPSKVSQDNLTKLELLQFVDAIPMDRLVKGHEAGSDEEAEVQATMALMSSSEGVAHPPLPPRPQHCSSDSASLNKDGKVDSTEDNGEQHRNYNNDNTSRESATATAAAVWRRVQRQEEEEEDAAAIESIMSCVSPATFPSSMARVLIYDAVCTCVADGLYSAKEKKRVALVSSHIGLSTAVRGQIEKLALQERVLSIRKRRLLLLQQPLVSCTPLEEERLQQAANVLSHFTKQEVEEGADANNSGHGNAQVLSDKAVGAVAAGRSQNASLRSSQVVVNTEEARRIEAAKKLLRRVRRSQKQQQQRGHAISRS